MDINSCFYSLKGEVDINVKLISVWSVKHGFASRTWLWGIMELGGEKKRWPLEHSKALITCIYHKAEILPPAPLRPCNIIAVQLMLQTSEAT